MLKESLWMKPTEDQKKAFAEEGGFVARGFLNPDQLKKARACFDWGIANPGRHADTVFPGTDHEHVIHNSNRGAYENGIKDLIHEAHFADYASELWGSEHVWYFSEELFMKKGGKAGDSPWHQDTSVMPTRGAHWANFWISFDALPKKNCLSLVRGSDKGPLYNGTDYSDPDDPTKPLHPHSDLPRLPEISADLARDPSSWDVIAWDLEPGDVLVFHPGCLHGGAPVDSNTPDRHTLVLRFFGDEAYYHPLPNTFEHTAAGMGDKAWRYLDSQVEGEPFRSKKHPQFR